MKHWMFYLLILSTTSVWANQSVLEETLYQHFKTSISHPHAKFKSMAFTKMEQTLFVDALWDALEEKVPEALATLDTVDTFHYDLVEKLRMGILRLKYQRISTLPDALTQEVENKLREVNTDIRLVYTIAAYEEDLANAGHKKLIKLARGHNAFFDVANDSDIKREYSEDVLTDLFYHTPDITTYMNGEYVKSVKIYMFCRPNRLFPCIMTMRDIHGEVVRNTDGSLWTRPALASSKQGLPSYSKNGNTPAGILTIDSVMPVADEQISYGKNRRMMLNFIPKSKDEVLLKSLLPPSSRDKDWWKTSQVARDIGRNLFRIHGTGKINEDPTTPYYPFVRTSGCIAQRENTYNGVKYNDQRSLLDAIMVAMDMQPVYANELKVKGILYLYEVDDEEHPLTVQELADRGIE